MARTVYVPPAETQSRSWTPGAYSRSKLYQPRPSGKNLGKETNKVIFTLFDQSTWPLFKVEDANDPFRFQNAITPENWSFYAKVPGHFVEMPGQRGVDRYFVICPPAFNIYLTDTLQQKPLFKPDHTGKVNCGICNAVRKRWDKYAEAWKYGHDVSGNPLPAERKGIPKPTLDVIHALNPLLRKLRDQTDAMRLSDRYVFQVFDWSKQLGECPMDQGEDSITHQAWFGPKAVYDILYGAYSNGQQFWLPNNPRPVAVLKDNSRGIRTATYTPTVLDPTQVSEELAAYLDNPEGYIQPTFGSMADGPADISFIPPDQSDEIIAIAYPDDVPFEEIPNLMANKGQSHAGPVPAPPGGPPPATAIPRPPVAPPPAPRAPVVPPPPAPAGAPKPAAKANRW